MQPLLLQFWFLFPCPIKGSKLSQRIPQKYTLSAAVVVIGSCAYNTLLDSSNLRQQTGWINPQFQHLGPQIWPPVTFAAFTFPQYPPSGTDFNYQESFNWIRRDLHQTFGECFSLLKFSQFRHTGFAALSDGPAWIVLSFFYKLLHSLFWTTTKFNYPKRSFIHRTIHLWSPATFLEETFSPAQTLNICHKGKITKISRLSWSLNPRILMKRYVKRQAHLKGINKFNKIVTVGINLFSDAKPQRLWYCILQSQRKAVMKIKIIISK